MDKTLQIVLEAISNIIDLDIDNFNENTHFSDIPNWDSLSAISLIAFCEREFNKSIPMSVVMKMQTIGELVNEIKNI